MPPDHLGEEELLSEQMGDGEGIRLAIQTLAFSLKTEMNLLSVCFLPKEQMSEASSCPDVLLTKGASLLNPAGNW